MKPTLTTFEDISASIAKYHANPSAYKGLSTGSPALDELVTLKEGGLVIVTGIPSSGKALALDTEIPVPHGWTTMGELNVGDQVFDENGRACNIVAVTDVMENRPCYKVTFNDGTEIVADANHEWLTSDFKARCSVHNSKAKGGYWRTKLQLRGTDQRHKQTHPSVKTTQEMVDSVMAENGKRANHHIKNAEPIRGYYNDSDLFVDPYTLGAWLGDGTSLNGGITSADPQIIENIRNCYEVTKRADKYAYGILGLQSTLREHDLLGNKHIPLVFLRAKYIDRLALLQGLMDTDGTVNKTGNCSFSNANEDLARDVKELVNSLGIVAHMKRKNGKFNGGQYISYDVSFTTNLPVFRLDRKLMRLPIARSKRVGYRSIVSIEKCESVPVKCIQVDSPNHLYLVTDAFIPTHNSELLDQIMLNTIALHDWHWSVYSPENWPLESHFQKLCEKWTGRPWETQGHLRGVTAGEVTETMTDLSNSICFLDMPDDKSMTVETLIEACTISDEKHTTNALLLDPWNELDGALPAGMSETMYINACLTRLRNYGRKHKILIVIVAHPTKLKKNDDGSYPVATPYDIAGSAAWRNKGDIIISVWRDYALNDGVVQAHVQKIRNKMLGKLGMVELHWLWSNGLFLDEKRDIADGELYAIKRRMK